MRKILSILLVAVLLSNHLSFSFYDMGIMNVSAIDEESSLTTTPEDTLNTTTEVTPSTTPEVTPSTTPEVTPSTTPEVTPSITPEITPSETPEVTPEITPSTTPEVTVDPTLDPSLPTLDEEEPSYNEEASNGLPLEDELNSLSVSRPDNATYGDFELKLPTTSGDGVVSDIKTIIYIKSDVANNNALDYLVTVYDEDGAIVSEKVYTFNFMHYFDQIGDDNKIYPAHIAMIGNLPPGSTIKVSDVAISGSVSSSTWNSSRAGAYLKNLLDKDGIDISSMILPSNNEENPIKLKANEVTTLKFIVDKDSQYYQNFSDNNFVTEGHYYAGGYQNFPYLDKLLNSINVFSYNDIEGTHIVGPIIAKNEAYYTRENPLSTLKSDAKLIFSDYSRGVPSYIGNLSARLNGGRDSAANYIYDRKKEDLGNFKPPNLYTSTSTKLVNNGNENWLQEFVVLPNYTTFMSPNDSGSVSIYHNDNYVNFEEIQSIILSESKKLLEVGSIENFNMETKFYDSLVDGPILNVEPGENWIIKNADKLEQINIKLPEGSDYFHSPSPDPLTINFECETINPTKIDELMVSRFPTVTINGSQFENAHLGEYVEFNEFGNRIIYNMPNIVTDDEGNNRIVTYAEGQNIPGHLIMPQAEFWNYQENAHGALEWEGGNINGMVLAKDVHLGEIEVHMWAYGGKEPKFASVMLDAKKTVNGLLPYQHFTFKLELSPGASTDGLHNTDFPMYDESDLNGDIQFQNIIFTKAGTYKFKLTEMSDNPLPGIKYDLSVYEVTVIVNDHLETSVSMIKTHNSNGEEVNENVDNIHFNNQITTRILPSTGGHGQIIYYTTGMMCIFIGSILYMIYQNKKQKRNISKGWGKL